MRNSIVYIECLRICDNVIGLYFTLGGVYMQDLVPVWKSYRYESRTGMKVVLVWKSCRYESRTGTRSCRSNTVTGMNSYRDELVLIWNFVPVSYKEKHGHNKNQVELIPVWKSYRYESRTGMKVVPVSCNHPLTFACPCSCCILECAKMTTNFPIR